MSSENKRGVGSIPQYKTVSVDTLAPYERNSRTHSPEQIGKLASAIDALGFAGIVVVRNGTIAKGHGTIAACKQLWDAGKTVYLPPDEHGDRYPLPARHIPIMDASGWSEADFKAFVISDNRLALDAGWDDEMLRLEFAELEAFGFDLELTGFSLDEIDGGYDVDEVGMPELPNGDKEPFQQKTFTLHDEQAAIVDDAVTLARTNPLSDTGLNENSNGNALALICQQWLESNGQG